VRRFEFATAPRRLVTAVAVVAAFTLIAGCGSRVRTTPRTRRRHDADGDGRPTTSNGNTAPDVGVTASEIHIGPIVSKTSPLGAETFSGPMYGALAYFRR
jgi:hypothetical protein